MQVTWPLALPLVKEMHTIGTVFDHAAQAMLQTCSYTTEHKISLCLPTKAVFNACIRLLMLPLVNRNIHELKSEEFAGY